MANTDTNRLAELQIEKMQAMLEANTAFTAELVKLNERIQQLLEQGNEQKEQASQQTELARQILAKFDNGMKSHIVNSVNSSLEKNVGTLNAVLDKLSSKLLTVMIGGGSLLTIIMGLLAFISSFSGDIDTLNTAIQAIQLKLESLTP